jgi:hypothetical protein
VLLFLELRVYYTDADWCRFTSWLSLTTPSFQSTVTSRLKLLCTGKNHDQQTECRSYRMALLDKNNTSSVILQHQQRGNRSRQDKETGAEVIRHEVEKYWCCSLSVRLMTIVLFIISFSPFIQCHCAQSTRPPSQRQAQ